MHPPFQSAPVLAALPGIRHGFFGREGGVSEGEFASLNVSARVGDDPANTAENRHRAVMALKAGPIPLALLRQTHSADVVVVKSRETEGDFPEADAMVTALGGIALGILTADCAPILLADADAGVIGAAHAGWRGAVSEILANTVGAMISQGARREGIVAAIGPAIQCAHYEVGEDFVATIENDHPEALPFIVRGDDDGRRRFDLTGLLIDQARSLGIAPVETVPGDTYGAPERYFSHRYGTHHGLRAGRQIALIARA